MADDFTKIHLKIGAVELQYEGPATFLKSELAQLLDAVAKINPGPNGSNQNHTNGKTDGVVPPGTSLPFDPTNQNSLTTDTVRRQNIWDRCGRDLTEIRPHLGVDIRRRGYGVASAAVRWSFA